MSDNVTGAHMDERFDALEEKIDSNAKASEARFRVLESRLPGHSEEQIIELIDERLQAVMPGMLREAVSDELKVPLKLVQDAIDSSHANRDAIKCLSETVSTVEANVATVKTSTDPIVEIVDGLQFIRRFLIAAGSLAGAVGLILAALNGLLS